MDYNIPISRRHAAGTAALEALITAAKEWGYEETDDMIGVRKADGATMRYHSRSKVMKPGTPNDPIITVETSGDVNVNDPAGNSGYRLKIKDNGYDCLQVESSVSGDTDDGPTFDLYKSATAAVDKVVGKCSFSGKDSEGNTHEYASIMVWPENVTDGSERGAMKIYTSYGGLQSDYYVGIKKGNIFCSGGELQLKEKSSLTAPSIIDSSTAQLYVKSDGYLYLQTRWGEFSINVTPVA